MLDGLEAAEVRFKDTFKSSETFRIDGEFYRKEFLQEDFNKLHVFAFNDICTIKSGTTPPDRDDELREGVILLKTTDIRNGVLSKENIEDFYFISREIANRMKETKLESGDVLLNIVGATTEVIGRTAFVPDDFPETNITQAMAFLRLTDKRIKPAYLFSFMAGKYGNKQVRRFARPTGQFNLNLQEVGKFQIPLLSLDFQKQIEKTVKAAHAKLEQSKRLYAEAEETLLDELGLKNWRPPKESAAVKTFKESVGKSGRLDAEFYQPKYDKLFAHLRKTGQAVRLADWVKEPIKRGTQPEYSDDGEILVINSQHVGKTEVKLENNSYTTLEFAEENERAVIGKYDVLLNSTGYITIGRCQTLLEDITAVVDGHVAIIRPKEGLDPVFLGIYLNALPGQLQTEQGWTGSSGQIELRRDIVENYVVWKPDMKIQARIHKLVENAYLAEQESKRLLELSKRAVEMSIKKGESKGMKVLEEA